MSFFLTTLAKKPRTECGCHPVAFVMMAMAAPFGCRSIPRTICCFDWVPVDLDETSLGADSLDAAGVFVLVLPGFLAGDRAGRDGLVVHLTGFDLGLLVAIWPSLVSTTASSAATDTSPAIQQGERERRKRSLFATQAIQQRGGVVKPASLVDQLLDFHRN